VLKECDRCGVGEIGTSHNGILRLKVEEKGQKGGGPITRTGAEESDRLIRHRSGHGWAGEYKIGGAQCDCKGGICYRTLKNCGKEDTS
jgi:hypothetical protein